MHSFHKSTFTLTHYLMKFLLTNDDPVVETLAQLALQGRKPQTISLDNGPEFTSKIMDQWAYLNGVELDFNGPGKPTDCAFIEAFNARLRAECLNENRFLSLGDARERIEDWRRYDRVSIMENGPTGHWGISPLRPSLSWPPWGLDEPQD